MRAARLSAAVSSYLVSVWCVGVMNLLPNPLEGALPPTVTAFGGRASEIGLDLDEVLEVGPRGATFCHHLCRRSGPLSSGRPGPPGMRVPH